jgi:ABC-2 type transport system permease protein
VFAPIVAVLTLDSVFAGVVCALGILSAAAAATAIQLCFRVQAQSVSPQADVVPSRYVCRGVFWAETTALAASASWAALGTAVVAFGVLAAVWLISPSRA